MEQPKNNSYIIDYMRVTIKPDKAYSSLSDLTADNILSVLGLDGFIQNATDIGSHDNYTHSYKQGDICVYTTDYSIMDLEQRKTASPEQLSHYCKMGMNICFTGSGCRSFEALNGEGFTWKSFFEKIQAIQNCGFSINYSRIDFAKDDRQGLLDMSIIAEHSRLRKYVSSFRVTKTTEHLLNSDIIETFKGAASACTVTFGNRKSNVFLRIYDKKMEQLCKHKKGSEEYNAVLSVSHWVRCEFEFRNNRANKLVAAMLKLSDLEFSEYLAEVMNNYIRFTEEQHGKTTRRTICFWWTDFLGTVKRSTLQSAPLLKNPFVAACNFLRLSVAPTLEALRRRLGDIGLLSFIKKSANPDHRFKQKHFDIMECSLDNMQDVITDSELWELITPYAVKERVACAVV